MSRRAAPGETCLDQIGSKSHKLLFFFSSLVAGARGRILVAVFSCGRDDGDNDDGSDDTLEAAPTFSWPNRERTLGGSNGLKLPASSPTARTFPELRRRSGSGRQLTHAKPLA
ncbi:hypothetical protein B0T22DRAFT_29438 [Podospora appendiculata]|uniref:Uncharacterized protein n=1 Tax=Podospora appendiculata TaxID=314037 RepID=A0AAE0XGE2_9PEZI|nr:hypothetical protein B0T22DRAFT_29438 [Podospora appendiculata]